MKCHDSFSDSTSSIAMCVPFVTIVDAILSVGLTVVETLRYARVEDFVALPGGWDGGRLVCCSPTLDVALIGFTVVGLKSAREQKPDDSDFICRSC